ncbi:transporter substrate-binding domain-containing protein [Vibrio alfacsensis]|uniref:ATP-binding protein n=1 Tax=Vibrio alfacsensis TaxID=1074311 RepID=UPI002ADDE849|nr:transporter substrate-binding domain-containing protein [Vibrio alfacsensis]WQE77396.1 transporter substrate-binding domain-containing protein [Vibrio alfacsensis]
MKRLLLFVLSSVLLASQTFATSISPQNEDTKQLVIGRQYDAHKYLWKSVSSGESNSNYADVVERFADSIGVAVSYRYFRESNELLNALRLGEVDLVVGYAKTQKGEEYFNFSQPIFNIRSVSWFYRSELRTKPMNELRWGCARYSVYCDVLARQSVSDLTTYKTSRSLIQGLANGEIDAIYTDVVSAEQYLSERTFGEWVGYINYFSPLPDFEASIAIAQSNTHLLEQVNQYLTEVRPSLDKNQHLLIEPLGNEALLKALHLEYGRGVIRYTIDENMRPFSYKDVNTNKQVGQIHDLMALMSRKSGIQFEYVPQNGRTPVDMLDANVVDLIPAVIDVEREDFIFTHAFGEINWVKIASKNKSGHGVTAVLDRTRRILLNEVFSPIDIPILYDDYSLIIDAMEKGQVDYAYLPTYVLENYAYDDSRKVYNIVLNGHMNTFRMKLGFELESNGTLLQSIMNDVLKLISANEVELLQLKHHRVTAQYGYDKSDIIIGALATLSLFLLVLVGYQTQANRLSKSLLKADEVAHQNAKRLKWLSDLLDRLPSMIAIYDESNTLVLSNKAFNKHGMRCGNFKTGQCLLKHQGNTFDGVSGHVCQCSYSHRHLRIIEDEISGMNDDKRYRLMVFDDYTKLEKQKQKLEDSNKKALKAIKSRDLFLATISHELRTPIAAMIGLMELMDGKVESVENIELLSNAQTSANRLRLLVNDILDISKIEANQFHLDARNGNVYSELGPLLRTYESNAVMKNVGFTVNWSLTPYSMAKLDWLRVAQVLNNLLSNAVKFTQEGEITVLVALTLDRLDIEVSDTGCGMSKAQLSRIFTPFAQADVSITRKYGGTGLGLTIVKSIVEMMSGTIDVQTDSGRGSCMRVSLPTNNAFMLDASDCGAVSEHPEINRWLEIWNVRQSGSTISMPTGWRNIYPDLILNALKQEERLKTDLESAKLGLSGNVLVVDDDPINRLLFSKQFSKLGLQPAFAQDGVEAYDYILKHCAELDLVVTDCHMPNMDGYELTKKIRSNPILSELKVVGCTAEDSKIVVEKAADAGMSHVIYKPYTLEELIWVLKAYLTQEKCNDVDSTEQENRDFGWLADYGMKEQQEVMQVVISSFSSERDLIKQGTELSQVIHRLKGSASMLMQDTLVQLALDWEQSKMDDVVADTQPLLDELDRLLNVFNHWLKTK